MEVNVLILQSLLHSPIFMGLVSNFLTSKASSIAAKKLQEEKDRTKKAVLDKKIAKEDVKAAYAERAAATAEKKAEAIRQSIPK